MRVAVEEAMTVKAAKAEAIDDFADAVALCFRPAERVRERLALDQLLHQHRTAAQFVVDAGHADEGVALEGVGEALLGGGFANVVEFAADALLQVADDRPRVQAASHQCREPDHHPHVRKVVFDRLAHAGVLHFDGDLRAVL